MINEIRKLIHHEKLEIALERLVDITNGLAPELHNTSVILKSRFVLNKTKAITGAEDKGENEIIKTKALKLLDDIEYSFTKG